MAEKLYDDLCKSKCVCRTRAGCRLDQHPLIAQNEFNVALILKTLVNAKTLEEMKAPLIDVVDNWISFEEKLPASCRSVWNEARDLLPHEPEVDMEQYNAWVDARRKEKGLDPINP